MFLLFWLSVIWPFLVLYQKEKVKEANILIMGHDEFVLGDETVRVHNWLRDKEFISEEPGFGKIKFKALESGGQLISLRVWRDYNVNVKIDAVVYVADIYDPRIGAMSNNLYQLLNSNFAHIFDSGWIDKMRNDLHQLPNNGLADIFPPGRIDEMRNELHQLLNDDSLANVPLLILGHPEMLVWLGFMCGIHLGLAVTCRGNVNLPDGVVNLPDGVRPFMIFEYRERSLVEAFIWLSRYIR